jgi:hypothetical protein
MNTRNVVSAVAGFLAVGASVVAAVSIRLLLTDPVRVVDAASGRNLAPLFHAVVGVIVQALSGLVRYL